MSRLVRALGLLLVVWLGPVVGTALHPLAHALEAADAAHPDAAPHDEVPGRDAGDSAHGGGADVGHACDVCAVHLSAAAPLVPTVPPLVGTLSEAPWTSHDAATVMSRARATTRGPPVAPASVVG